MTTDDERLAAWMDDDREPYGKLPDHAEGPWLPPDWPPQLHPAVLAARRRRPEDLETFDRLRLGQWLEPVLDPSLPPGIIELRLEDGTVVGRIVGL